MEAGHIRASDADRERVAGELGDHAAAGRLSLDELSERVERAFGARTLGELRALFADLPSTAPLPRRRAIRRLPTGAMVALALAIAAQAVLWAAFWLMVAMAAVVWVCICACNVVGTAVASAAAARAGRDGRAPGGPTLTELTPLARRRG